MTRTRGLVLALVAAACLSACNESSETAASTTTIVDDTQSVTIRRSDMCTGQWLMSYQQRIWEAIDAPSDWDFGERVGTITSVDAYPNLPRLTYLDADGTTVRFERRVALGSPCS